MNVGPIKASQLSAPTPETLTTTDGARFTMPAPAPVELTGYTLTDTASNPNQWGFPPGVAIPANGYLVVWADNEPYQFVPGRDGMEGLTGSTPHCSFKLNPANGSILLFSPVLGSPALDSVSWTTATPQNRSRGRCGAGYQDFITPTPGQANCP